MRPQTDPGIKDKIIEGCQQTNSKVKELSIKYQVGIDTIYRWLRTDKIVFSKRRYTVLSKDQIILLYQFRKKGYLLRTIAEALNIKPTTLTHRFQKMNLPLISRKKKIDRDLYAREKIENWIYLYFIERQTYSQIAKKYNCTRQNIEFAIKQSEIDYIICPHCEEKINIQFPKRDEKRD